MNAPGPGAVKAVPTGPVLVVDDRSLNRKYLCTVLRYAGYTTLEAADGREALQQALRQRPALMICDILMPTMNGYELVEQLRADIQLADLPVIFYTATYAAAQARRVAATYGVDIVLPKPSSPVVVLEAVNRSLGLAPAVAAPPPLTPPVETDTLQRIGEQFERHTAELRAIAASLGQLSAAGSELRHRGDQLRALAATQAENTEQIARVGTRLNRVLALGMKLGLECDGARIAALVFDTACQLIDADCVGLGLEHLDFAPGRLAHGQGVDPRWYSEAAPGSELPGVLREVVGQGRPRRLHSPQRLAAETLPPGHPEVCALLAVPLASRDEVYGWLYFAQRTSTLRFTEEDECIAGTLGALAAMFIENRRLYHREQRHALELQAEISQRQRAEEARLASEQRLESIAFYDPLTRLANRRLFGDRLAQYLETARQNGRQVAVILADLERFKGINEMLGLNGGDEVLKLVARRLLDFAGLANCLARVGANQFAIIVPDVQQPADLTRLLNEQAWRSLWHPYDYEGRELRLSARLGIALFPGDGSDAEALLGNAEAALMKAKRSGERYLFYTQQMSESIREKLRLEIQLRRALEEREFVLHYQPKVDLRSGAICGAEALIRWDSPTLGLVPPQQFIGLLEETGLINEVGRWVLGRAAADHAAWQAAGLPAPPVAVNVSAQQLRQPDFVEQLAAALAPASGRPAELQLEVTESLLMDDTERTLVTLEQVRQMGVTIAIDDFGTAYSSLSYLARLPISAVKIDRSFVVRMTASADTMSIVSAILSLARSMNLKIIAEGVDSEEQLKFLRLLRCDEMQGFLFSPAVPAGEFAAMLRRGQRLAGMPTLASRP